MQEVKLSLFSGKAIIQVASKGIHHKIILHLINEFIKITECINYRKTEQQISKSLKCSQAQGMAERMTLS